MWEYDKQILDLHIQHLYATLIIETHCQHESLKQIIQEEQKQIRQKIWDLEHIKRSIQLANNQF